MELALNCRVNWGGLGLRKFGKFRHVVGSDWPE